MFSAVARALGQFDDLALRRPLAWSVVLSIVIFLGLLGGVYLVLAHTTFFETFWLNAVIDALGGLAALALTVLLFPGIVAAIPSRCFSSASSPRSRRATTPVCRRRVRRRSPNRSAARLNSSPS